MNYRRAALALALLVPIAATAQLPGGPYAPIVLLLPANTRLLSLGNTGVASRDEPLFYNPAQLVVGRGVTASFERYSSSSAGGAMSSITPFSTGAVAIGARLVDYEALNDAFPADRSRLLDSGPASGTSFEAAIGIGQVIKGVRVGGAAKYVEDNVPAERVGRAAFDIGLAKDFLRFYTVGLAVQNIGSSMTVPCEIATSAHDGECATPTTFVPLTIVRTTTARLPLRTTLGASTSRALGEFDVSATAAVSLLRTNFFIPSGGAEASYSWLDGYAIALRAGGRRPLPGEGGFTAGAGFSMDRLTIDYALETLSHSHLGQRIGLRIR